MTEDQIRARQLYSLGKEVKEIHEELDIPMRTLYTWKNDAEHKWEETRQLAQMSPESIGLLLLEGYKKNAIDIANNPEKLQNPAIADSLLKTIKAIKSLEKDADYLGVGTDIMKLITLTIKDEFPESLGIWKKITPRIFEILEKNYGR